MRKKVNKNLVRRYLRINNTNAGTKANRACRDWWIARVDLTYNIWTGEYALPEFYSSGSRAVYPAHIVCIPVPYHEMYWDAWWEEATLRACKGWIDDYVEASLAERIKG